MLFRGTWTLKFKICVHKNHLMLNYEKKNGKGDFRPQENVFQEAKTKNLEKIMM